MVKPSVKEKGKLRTVLTRVLEKKNTYFNVILPVKNPSLTRMCCDFRVLPPYSVNNHSLKVIKYQVSKIFSFPNKATK